MSNDIVQQINLANPFDSIRRIHVDSTEYWSARDLMPLLGYGAWAKFADSIDRARAACRASRHETADHFALAGKMVTVGSGAKRTVEDVNLSRYAAYLVAMNSDARKVQVALAQTYFVVETRKAELARILPSPDFSQLEALAGLTVRAITHQVEAAKTELVAYVDARIGSQPATSEQRYDVKRLVKHIVSSRQRLGLANGIFAQVYRECWDACRIGSIAVMTQDQYPHAVTFLRAELARLAALGDSGLFSDDVLTRGASA